ncbi:diaminopimelate aminotransferase [Archaeoglobales archaeon]|nr:MAG: diaminopimelate aminotransferase [Archaeoglobales archaeon]
MELFSIVESFRDEIVETLSNLIEIKALSPEWGGEGEYDKAEYLMTKLGGLEVERYDAEDSRAKFGIRPNIVARLHGKTDKTIWFVSHLDVVPEGDPKLWETDPFKAVVKNGRIYGRGSEDNGQAIVSTLYAAKSIIKAGLKPECSIGLVFVADEETGSKYGIQHLLKKNVFSKGDLFIVPDAGSPNGNVIEIAEKSILWIKFKIHGIQAHASTPKNLNAARRAMKFLMDLDEKLHSKFNLTNNLFNPPISTFEPTKREKNIDNINTIPGLDVSYMDCRILPNYDIEEVVNFIEDVRKFYEIRDNAKIEMEIIQKESSPMTPEDSEVVEKLKAAIEKVRGVKVELKGIGGNTCAAFFRKAGFETAVWSTIDGMAHQPNEYAVIDNIVNDAKVFAFLPFV